MANKVITTNLLNYYNQKQIVPIKNGLTNFKAEKGAKNGLATLNDKQKITPSQLPDTMVVGGTTLPSSPEMKVLYILDDGSAHIWDGIKWIDITVEIDGVKNITEANDVITITKYDGSTSTIAVSVTVDNDKIVKDSNGKLTIGDSVVTGEDKTVLGVKTNQDGTKELTATVNGIEIKVGSSSGEGGSVDIDGNTIKKGTDGKLKVGEKVVTGADNTVLGSENIGGVNTLTVAVDGNIVHIGEVIIDAKVTTDATITENDQTYLTDVNGNPFDTTTQKNGQRYLINEGESRKLYKWTGTKYEIILGHDVGVDTADMDTFLEETFEPQIAHNE